ncbi:zinc-ribbon domain-containing protein [Alloacidobacterium dinghuense]|uniref:Zinc-ribbon domain-containing protein n=1 Tax=Alloacidobacterium dinghuense TaxID=2763107 RepID=A0A7G8BGY7_9BACT|nr:zinc-ribbon domain-containing protein [Alloacidobacterium dinghuense]QNI31807.1 zinc-ribbon domain-containing protein [Alloacidobacterium dinghuense]
MQCPSCHNEISPQASFCGFCGASLAAAPAGGPAAAPAGYTPVGASSYAAPAAAPVSPAAGGLSENAAAAIAYITIIPAIIFLVLEPYNRMRLVKFHSIQCIALHVAWIAVWIAITIMHVVLHFVPFIYVLFLLVDLAISVGFFIVWLLCILKASKGEYFKLPVIGDFAAKQAGV